MIALKHLRVDVHPAIVEIGYRNFNSRSVADTARELGFSPIILSLQSDESVSFIPERELISYRQNQSLLLSNSIRTPCALCSRTKRSVLYSYAAHVGSRWVALGHHRDDFVVTFLKDYWVDSYYSELGAYSADHFSNFISTREIDFRRLQNLLLAKKASTMAIRLHESMNADIIRPLAFVAESEIVDFVISSNISTHGSGCAHDTFFDPQSTMTKREIVHADFHRRLKKNPELGELVSRIALQSLAPDGSPAFENPRALRPQSMPGFCPDE
jgi:tRNA(Ile)-lysidine synthase TilS/MesJ